MLLDSDSRMIHVLLKLAPTVNWLTAVEPIDSADIPEAHHEAMKQLEVLGLVYRRNARNCGLQRQRLIKMLKRESAHAPTTTQERCSSAFASLLQCSGISHQSTPEHDHDSVASVQVASEQGLRHETC